MSNSILTIALNDGNECSIVAFDAYRLISFVSRVPERNGIVLAKVKIEYGIPLTINSLNKLYKALTK